MGKRKRIVRKSIEVRIAEKMSELAKMEAIEKSISNARAYANIRMRHELNMLKHNSTMLVPA